MSVKELGMLLRWYRVNNINLHIYIYKYTEICIFRFSNMHTLLFIHAMICIFRLSNIHTSVPFIYTVIYVLDEAICILLCYLKMLWYDSFIKFCRWGNMVSFILRDISFICVHKFQQGMCVLKPHYMFSWPKENGQGRPPLNHLQFPLFPISF